MDLPKSAIAIVTAQFVVTASVSGAEDCGIPGKITVKNSEGKKVKASTREFADGSIAVRARLAVNPDGGPASYTVGDHGFTYLHNGMSRWNGNQTQSCDATCAEEFAQAAKADFGPGTPMFCVFGMEVEALTPEQSPKSCQTGYLAGNGIGRPTMGALLETVTGEKIQAYFSATSLRHMVDGKARYLDAELLPVAVTPTKDLLGKVVWIGGAGYKPTWAVLGDSGPAFGEGSIALHQLLRYGKVSPQKPGPIPVAKRCGPEELNLKAPFVSKPDIKTDRCRQGHVASSGSDIRAYTGINQMLDFLILGKDLLAKKGGVIQSQVTQEALQAAASPYSAQRIQQMLSCLPKEPMN